MTAPAWLFQPEGPVPYPEANQLMHELARGRLAGEIPDSLMVLEHPLVFTAGRRSRSEELLCPQAELTAVEIGHVPVLDTVQLRSTAEVRGIGDQVHLFLSGCNS